MNNTQLTLLAEYLNDPGLIATALHEYQTHLTNRDHNMIGFLIDPDLFKGSVKYVEAESKGQIALENEDKGFLIDYFTLLLGIHTNLNMYEYYGGNYEQEWKTIERIEETGKHSHIVIYSCNKELITELLDRVGTEYTVWSERHPYFTFLQGIERADQIISIKHGTN